MRVQAVGRKTGFREVLARGCRIDRHRQGNGNVLPRPGPGDCRCERFRRCAQPTTDEVRPNPKPPLLARVSTAIDLANGAIDSLGLLGRKTDALVP